MREKKREPETHLRRERERRREGERKIRDGCDKRRRRRSNHRWPLILKRWRAHFLFSIFHPSSFYYLCRLIFFSSMWYASCVVLRLLLYSHWENWSLNTSQPYLPNNCVAAGLGCRENEGYVRRCLPACFQLVLLKGFWFYRSIQSLSIYLCDPLFHQPPVLQMWDLVQRSHKKKSSDLIGTNQIKIKVEYKIEVYFLEYP